MPKKRVIVTGGAGFIGSHTVDALVDEGYTVVVIDKAALKYSNATAIYKINIANLKRITEIFSDIKPDYVIHCAAEPQIQRSIDDPVGTFNSNCRGTLNILLASRDFKVKRVVYSASSSAYGFQFSLPLAEYMTPNPLNPYALYKYFGEDLCRIFSELYGLKTVSLRYFNVFGPRQKLEGPYSTVIPIFLDQLKKGEPMTIVPNGHQARDFTYISDVVRANLLAMKSEKVGNGDVINIGAGKSHTIFELKDIIGGKDYPWKFVESRKAEIRETCASIVKAKALLAWEPSISLKDGIELLKKEIV